MEINLSESAWSRGRSDTARGMHNPLFWIVDAGGGAMIGAIFSNAWLAVAWIVGCIICLWIGATAGAPRRQRDEARAQLAARLELPPLADRLDKIASQIRDFKRELDASMPAPNDALNYVSPSLEKRVQTSGVGNMVISGEDDDFKVRMRPYVSNAPSGV